MKKTKLNVQKCSIAKLANSDLLAIKAGGTLKSAGRDCTYITCRDAI